MATRSRLKATPSRERDHVSSNRSENHRAKRGSHAAGSDKRWLAKVKTVSTFPPKDAFTKDAETIAKTMASKKVSPMGLGSAVRMVQYFINRAGKSLPQARRRELEKAKRILQEMNAKRRPAARSSKHEEP
jgi:Protein of unknown function (DUF3175)